MEDTVITSVGIIETFAGNGKSRSTGDGKIATTFVVTAGMFGALALYGSNDMREKPGCAILLRKTADRWEGATPGTGCPSIRRAAPATRPPRARR